MVQSPIPCLCEASDIGFFWMGIRILILDYLYESNT